MARLRALFAMTRQNESARRSRGVRPTTEGDEGLQPLRLDVLFAATTAALSAGIVALIVLAPGRAPIPKDVLVVGQLSEPRSLDPATVTGADDFRVIANLFEGLVRFRPGTLEPAPALAERWEILDAGKTYVFRLRPNLRFHDGTALDAEAVKFTFERMLDPKHPAASTGPFPLSFFFKPVKRVEVVDPLTVRFRLDAPYAPLLANLAHPAASIVSPAAVTKLGKRFGRAPVGSGPFRFALWESNRQVRLERFEAFREGAPKLAALVFRPIPDANARISEMLAGGLDVMVELPPDALKSFRDPERFTLHEAQGPHLWYLILNARRGPFADVRVRQAANYAIDKRAIVEDVLQGVATIPAGPIALREGGDAKPYPHDFEKARALVREAGAEGAKMSLLVPESGPGMLEPVAMATAIQADLARIGLSVSIRTFEWNSYLARVNGGLGDADMAAMAWMTTDPDTLPTLTLSSAAMPEKGGFNAGGFEDPGLDPMLDAARAELDPDKRTALYRSIDARLRDAAPWAFVARWTQNAVTAKGVEGFALQPSFLLDLRGVSKP